MSAAAAAGASRTSQSRRPATRQSRLDPRGVADAWYDDAAAAAAAAEAPEADLWGPTAGRWAEPADGRRPVCAAPDHDARLATAVRGETAILTSARVPSFGRRIAPPSRPGGRGADGAAASPAWTPASVPRPPTPQTWWRAVTAYDPTLGGAAVPVQIRLEPVATAVAAGDTAPFRLVVSRPDHDVWWSWEWVCQPFSFRSVLQHNGLAAPGCAEEQTLYTRFGDQLRVWLHALSLQSIPSTAARMAPQGVPSMRLELQKDPFDPVMRLVFWDIIDQYRQLPMIALDLTPTPAPQVQCDVATQYDHLETYFHAIQDYYLALHAKTLHIAPHVLMTQHVASQVLTTAPPIRIDATTAPLPELKGSITSQRLKTCTLDHCWVAASSTLSTTKAATQPATRRGGSGSGSSSSSSSAAAAPAWTPRRLIFTLVRYVGIAPAPALSASAASPPTAAVAYRLLITDPTDPLFSLVSEPIDRRRFHAMTAAVDIAPPAAAAAGLPRMRERGHRGHGEAPDDPAATRRRFLGFEPREGHGGVPAFLFREGLMHVDADPERYRLTLAGDGGADVGRFTLTLTYRMPHRDTTLWAVRVRHATDSERGVALVQRFQSVLSHVDAVHTELGALVDAMRRSRVPVLRQLLVSTPLPALQAPVPTALWPRARAGAMVCANRAVGAPAVWNSMIAANHAALPEAPVAAQGPRAQRSCRIPVFAAEPPAARPRDAAAAAASRRPFEAADAGDPAAVQRRHPLYAAYAASAPPATGRSARPRGCERWTESERPRARESPSASARESPIASESESESESDPADQHAHQHRRAHAPADGAASLLPTPALRPPTGLPRPGPGVDVVAAAGVFAASALGPRPSVPAPRHAFLQPGPSITRLWRRDQRASANRKIRPIGGVSPSRDGGMAAPAAASASTAARASLRALKHQLTATQDVGLHVLRDALRADAGGLLVYSL
ncbi:hypothetical protein CXG81DRAFT_17365 [Caulochytrium protostelioides]|uniref:Uncharacterized protein n=1 Tax=Caulochytrium protostelioides TaxID=1555241 RepID=A0A4P9XC55_9FUNG|nr:hypothetical protein CXG81DRAFT_17365 [Caulochytrium protostelioides]|eukprot:RKP03008.1 hypothetical protein CXG81DRAFT_17365 [Caulochytrium protostelioides]